MYAIDSSASLASLRDEWDELADRIGSGPFVRPGWFEAWAGAFGKRPLQVLAVRADGRLAAVMPFVRARAGMVAPTNWHTPVFGAVADSQGALDALADALLGRGAARVDLGQVDAADPLLAAMRRAAERGGHRVVERTAMRSPYIRLDADFDAYRAGLARKMRKELGRLGRRLADEGQVEYEFADGSERLEQLLEEGFAVEGSGWKSEGGSAIVSRADTHGFYRDVARSAATRGTLVLAFLRLDGSALAFDLCIEQSGACNVLKGGFDPEYRRFGPGTLLTEASIARAYERGLASFELLGAEDEYKRAWTSSSRERVRFQAFAPSPVGRVSHLAWTRGRSVAKRVVGRVRARRAD